MTNEELLEYVDGLLQSEECRAAGEGDPVNWADLRVRHITAMRIVFIEEISPAATGVKKWIQSKLHERGLDDVILDFDW